MESTPSSPYLMKPSPASDWDSDQIQLVCRWYRLRRMGLLYPILHSGGTAIYTFTDLSDPWGSRQHLGWDVLGRDVEAAESVMITRKEIGYAHSRKDSSEVRFPGREVGG
jgi:hypothetical protein